MRRTSGLTFMRFGVQTDEDAPSRSQTRRSQVLERQAKQIEKLKRNRVYLEERIATQFLRRGDDYRQDVSREVQFRDDEDDSPTNSRRKSQATRSTPWRISAGFSDLPARGPTRARSPQPTRSGERSLSSNRLRVGGPPERVSASTTSTDPPAAMSVIRARARSPTSPTGSVRVRSPIWVPVGRASAASPTTASVRRGAPRERPTSKASLKREAMQEAMRKMGSPQT